MINLANRDDGLGLVTNIVLAVSLAALGNAIIYSQAWDRSVENLIQPSFAPPGYVVGIVWLFLFAAALFKAHREPYARSQQV